jgi:hypothetical protein
LLSKCKTVYMMKWMKELPSPAGAGFTQEKEKIFVFV